MNLLVVVLLGALWASILIPGLLRDRPHRSPSASVDAFERSMDILAKDLRARAPKAPKAHNVPKKRAPGRHVLVVSDRDAFAGRPSRLQTLRRRRQVLQALTALTLASSLVAVVGGAAGLAALAVSGTALVSYTALLARIRGREHDRRRTLRHLPAPDAGPVRVATGDVVADRPA